MKKILIYSLTLIMLLSFKAPLLAQEDEDEQNSYYLVVESIDWQSMTRDEKIEACQFPLEYLNSLSTSNLLELVLENPFMLEMLAFDTVKDGFSRVYSDFPALSILASRKDIGEVLIARYNGESIVRTGKVSSDSSYNINFLYMEILFHQPEMRIEFSEVEVSRFVQAINKKNIDKQKSSSIYEGSLSLYHEELENEYILSTRATTTVKTPKGSLVTVTDNTNLKDWTSAEIKTINAQYAKLYPNAKLVRDPSKKYNCHSYAWYSTSASNKYWMNNPSKYMSDGSYKKVTSAVGTKIYYANEHTGIVIAITMIGGNQNVTVRSKWGNLGVYEHSRTHCPYSASQTYWKLN